MDFDYLAAILDNPSSAAHWLQKLGIRDTDHAHHSLVSIAEAGVTLDLLSDLTQQLEQWLPHTSDPDRVLRGLERFVLAARSPISLACLFERDRESLPTLLQLLSTSQFLAELLILDPAGFDLLRLTEGSPIARQDLVEEISSEVDTLADEASIMNSLRQYKRRELLRISYGDVIRGHDIDTVTQQLSFLADALVEAASRSAYRALEQKYGTPRDAQGKAVTWSIIALGKLGGNELNYSSDIDLMVLYGSEGRTDGTHKIDNTEYFERAARSMLHMLSEITPLGAVYRVDFRLRPLGRSGPLAISEPAARHYYDVLGRTWERQAFVKARPVAGSLTLGAHFLQQLESWIYRRYLNRADISGIKALKRRIENLALREQGDRRNVKTGHGGIRDIEFVIQFLQLLNGGDLPEIRTANTLEAILRLEQVGCLTMQERTLLEENYRFLRRVEHRLQIMFDLQTHTLPADHDELRKLSLRLGYRDTTNKQAVEQFQDDYAQRTQVNRKILDHLLHDAFSDDDQAEPEVDLVLDPDPSPSSIAEVLGRYPFSDIEAAYKNLMDLAHEPIPFLSTRRCRHFLASIAPRLLPLIAETPDPDATLVELSRVSDSLGGKTVLWELFSTHPPSMQLYVRLCAGAPYLSGILTSNPGMIDELLDSLILGRLPSLTSLCDTLQDLCRGADNVDLILNSFKNSQHLRVGVRDIWGKEDVQSTTGALADIAESCLRVVVEREYAHLVAKYGYPTASYDAGQQPPNSVDVGSHSPPPAEPDNRATTEIEPSTASPRLQLGEPEPSELIVLALGKLGAREPNYHSDLDLMFVYSQEGTTRHPAGRKKPTTSNQHFFSELGQRIIKAVNQLGPGGRLYEVDLRLRPTGKNGSIAVSQHELQRYFEEGQGHTWERQALCQARPIYGSAQAAASLMKCVRHCISVRPWQPDDAVALRAMRLQLEESASPRNIKRGAGGTMDVEFLVQMWQLQHAVTHPEVLQSGTLNALQQLEARHLVPQQDSERLRDAYRFLRGVEARLRLMNTTARHDLPDDPLALQKLAYLLRLPGPDTLAERCRATMASNREIFLRTLDQVIS